MSTKSITSAADPNAGVAQSSSSPDFTFKVVRSFEEAAAWSEAWNDLVAESGADIYQLFQWCEQWWRFYGTRRRLAIVLAFRGETLVGVAPAYTETLWLGIAYAKVARLIGSDFSLTLCNLAATDDALPALVRYCADLFLETEDCDLFLFGPLSGVRARIEEIQRAGESADAVGSSRILGDTCNTFFSLPATFDEYLKSLDKKQRSNFKRMVEQSSKSHRLTFDVISGPEEVIAEFEAFKRQHEVQWQADGKLGHFGDWPHALEFNRALVKAFAHRGMIRFYRILADGEVVSSQYCLVFRNEVYWRLPARVRNAEWDRFSLGTVGLVKMIESMLVEGHRKIEGGRGHYAYKVHHGAKEFPLRTIEFRRTGFWVNVRASLLHAFARALDVIYYKIVFARLSPRFPALRRPIWKTWIRSSW